MTPEQGSAIISDPELLCDVRDGEGDQGEPIWRALGLLRVDAAILESALTLEPPGRDPAPDEVGGNLAGIEIPAAAEKTVRSNRPRRPKA